MPSERSTTPQPSSSTVRVVYAPAREAVIDACRRYAEDLAARDADVDEVLLFGSYARDEHSPGSDADLLIVLARSDHERPSARIARYLPTGLPVPVDVLPLTRAEVEARRAEGDAFLSRALAEGVVVYSRSVRTG